MLRLRTVFLVLPAAAIIAALGAMAACSSSSNDPPSGSNSSEVRNDGKEEGATNPGKLSCEAHGFTGIDTVVDLGGVNRTLDLGNGHSVTISDAHAGPNWSFSFSSDLVMSLILVRSGNQDSTITLNPPASSGHVTRADAVGPTKPGLNRIAFCFVPPPTPVEDAGQDAAQPDAAPPPEDAGQDGGQTW
jgi:hypothetical protein